MAKRRSKLEIYLNILNEADEKIVPTRLMSATNLSWISLMKYLKYLVEINFIEKIANKKEKPWDKSTDKRTTWFYETTFKGQRFLQHHRQIYLELQLPPVD